MKDSEDHATLELPGLMPAAPALVPLQAAGRSGQSARQQVQLELLEPVDLSGLAATVTRTRRRQPRRIKTVDTSEQYLASAFMLF